MTQNPGQWGQQGGYPQGQPPQGAGQPPQGGVFPPQGGGFPSQGGGFPPQQYPPQQGTYNPQGGYNPQAGYGQPGAHGQPGYGQPGYGAAQPAYGGRPAPTTYGPQPGGGKPPGKKSPALIIGIVAAAVVLIAAVGGIILVLNKPSGTDPGSTITPGSTTQPTTQPTDQPTDQPTGQTTDQPTTDAPTDEPTGGGGGQPGSAVPVGSGVSVTPAEGWSVTKQGDGVVSLSNGKELYKGQALPIKPAPNPAQLCDSWHKQVAKQGSDGQFATPKAVDLKTGKLKAADCQAVFTISTGGGSGQISLYSLVSVRTDGLTILGTAYFTKSSNVEQLNKDFNVMINSMLESQLAA